MLKIALFLLLPLLSFALTTSVIIPCHPAHFRLLETLLNAYRDQTVLPDEIVISLSEAQKIPALQIAALESQKWPFTLKILKHAKPYPPGKNRNEAAAASTGELILCQDADDLPHPQRVEIVRFLFETKGLDHLIHQWIGPEDEFMVPYDLMNLPLTSFRVFGLIDTPNIHNGSVCILRSVFEKVRWKPYVDRISEDVEFNRIAYSFCKNRAILELPLVMYRTCLSTFDLEALKIKNGEK